MKRWMWSGMIVALVAALLVGVVGSVSAQGPDNRPGRPFMRMADALIGAAVDATGLEQAEIWAALREGQSLAEVIEANGGDPAAVIAAAKADLTAQIEQAVEDGWLAELRAEQLLSNLDAALEQAMNRVHADCPCLDGEWGARQGPGLGNGPQGQGRGMRGQRGQGGYGPGMMQGQVW